MTALFRALSRCFLAGALVAACAGSGATTAPGTIPGGQDTPRSENAEFTLRVGEAAAFRDPALRLRMDAVDSDSRCPANVTCIWAGDAVVRLSLTGADGASGAAALHTNAQFERDTTFQQRRVTLVRLLPVKRDDRQITQSDYEGVFIVSR